MCEPESAEKLAGFSGAADQNDRFWCGGRFFHLGLAEARAIAGYPKNTIPTADYTCVSQNQMKNWWGSVGQLIKMTDFDVGVDSFYNL